MRRPVSVRLFFFLSFILLSTVFVLAQGSKMRPTADPDEQGIADADDPAARDAWFRKGRTSPDGQPISTWVIRAYTQKMQMRANLRNRLKAMSTQLSTTALQPMATIPVANGSAIWSPMGPGPMVDDANTYQNYGPNAGRITAVAADPNDSTGNRVLVGSATGGVWATANAAATDPKTVYWTPLFDQQPTLTVGSVSWKPDSSVILVGSGEGNSAWDSYYGLGIFRTVDFANSWTQITTSADGHSFLGLGVQRQAWSKTSTNVVAIATVGASRDEGAYVSNVSRQGLYYSTDSGVTWRLAQFYDGSTAINATASSNSVAWNPVNHKFYAHLRYHGIYVSRNADDPSIFDRLASQPDAPSTTTNSLNNLANCPSNPTTTSNFTSCPIMRAEIAIHPTRNEIYIWWIDSSGTTTKGFWKSLDSGATWTKLTDTGFTSCGDSAGCGASQAFYNMTVLAVSNPTTASQTDLYVGSVNMYKCTLDNTLPNTNVNALCGNTTTDSPFRFKNLTHVYGCYPPSYGEPAHVHPDHHDMSAVSGTSIIYFGHDGGVSRTLNSANVNTGLCTGTNAFDNLNHNMGALTQLVWGTAVPNDAKGALAGSQDNGTAAVYGSLTPTNGQTWVQVNGGDGGYNAIDPNSTSTWYSANTYVSVQKSTDGIASDRNSWTDLITDTSVASDSSAFYTPYMLDPNTSGKILLGTCRIWRGPTSTAWGTSGGTAISPMLTSTGTCSSTDYNIVAIAAGSATIASGTNAGASKVIWASLDSGRVAVTFDSGATTPLWTSVTPSTTLNPGYPVAGIAVDHDDPTGKTAFVAIQGFHAAHVLKTTDGGTTWSDISSGLPDAPANNIIIDPDDHNVLYVGTDVGVFSLDQSLALPTWQEVGPLSSSGSAGYLPNVPVFRVIRQNVGTRKLLKAITYGRGAWIADISPDGTPSLAVTPSTDPTLSFGTVSFPSSSTKTVTLSNSGTAALTISNAVLSDETNFAINNISCGDLPVSIAQGGSCQIAVTFHPQTNGDLPSTLTLTDNAGGHVLNFVGTGADIVPATVTPSPSPLTFANTPLNTALLKRLTLSNPGSVAVSITAITFSGAAAADFTQTNACNNTIAAGGTCLLDVIFKPSTTGTRSATLTIAHDGTLSPATVNLSGTGEDFVQSANVSSATVSAGNSATFTITETPASGTFSSPITFSCTGLHTTMSCLFNPTQLTPGTTAASTTLTVTTLRPTSTFQVQQSRVGRGRRTALFAFWLGLPGMAIFISATRKRGLSWKIKAGLFLLLLAGVLAASACGGGGTTGGGGTSGTPAGTYTIGVVATSGSLTHTTTVTVTVQ